MIVRFCCAALVMGAFCAPVYAEGGKNPFPARKEGLWEHALSMGEGMEKPLVSQMCVDQDVDEALWRMGEEMGGCSSTEPRKEGEEIVFESTCTFAGVETTSTSRLKGDFEKAYTISVSTRAKTKPGASPTQKEMSKAMGGETTMMAKYLGPCKEGQKPGDVFQGGNKIATIRKQPAK